MNIIIYVVDALRADHLSCYGYKRETTPNIDQVANEGVLFENAFTQSTWTRCAATSLLSSLYPSTHGVYTRRDFVPESLPWLPRVLQESNFKCFATSAIGNFSSSIGFSLGFDDFVDLYKDESLQNKREEITAEEEKLFTEDKKTPLVLPIAKDLVEATLTWIENNHSSDLFCVLWSIDTHDPYNPPKGFNRFDSHDTNTSIDGSSESVRRARSPEDFQRLSDLYDGEILYSDYEFGKFIKELKRMDIYDDTLIILTSDHGEAFGEHGNRSHGDVPYEELIHIPLIVKFPNGKFGGRRINGLVELVDIAPTIQEFCKISDDQFDNFAQGESLIPLIKGSKNGKTYTYSETKMSEAQAAFLSIRSERWKYIDVSSPKFSPSSIKNNIFSFEMLKRIFQNPVYYFRKLRPSAKSYLFDLINDPKELTNQAKQLPKKCSKLQRLLNNWLYQNQQLQGTNFVQEKDIEIDEKTVKHLRDLGYLD